MQHPRTLIAAAAAAPVGVSRLDSTMGWRPATRRLRARSGRHTLDAQFINVLAAFRGCGGLAPAEEALAWLDGEVEQGLSTLARWIALREVVSLEWQAQIWLPLFQFDRRDMSIHPQMPPVMAELRGVFDEWELVHWFARPNRTLDGLIPAEAFRDDPTLVLQAARTDRWAIEG